MVYSKADTCGNYLLIEIEVSNPHLQLSGTPLRQTFSLEVKTATLMRARFMPWVGMFNRLFHTTLLILPEVESTLA